MRHFLPLFILIGLIKGQGSSYLSPGLQIGISTKGNLFLSTQVTFGYLEDVVFIPIGVTTGLRWYKVQNKWEKYRYNDLQFWPFFWGLVLVKCMIKMEIKVLGLKQVWVILVI